MQRECSLFICLCIIVMLGCQTTSKNTKNYDGVAYFGQAKYDKALLAFQSGAQQGDADALYNMGATYARLGKVSAASNDLTLARQQLAAAEEAYRQCLAVNTHHAPAYRGLSVLWSEMGYDAQAFDLLIGWNRRDPTSADAKVELARLYQEYGRQEETQFLLQSVLAHDPNNARALRAMGYLYDKTGQTVLAADNYRRSLTTNPQQPDLQSRLQVIAASGMTQQAQSAASTTPARVF